jgi:hypothetical protein
MKITSFVRLLAVVLAVFSPQIACAQTDFSTQNFNTNVGYERGFGIISTSQPIALRWEGNDPYNAVTEFGETDLVARVVGYTPAPTSNSSLIQGGLGASDGVLPGTNNVSIWKSFGAFSGSPVVSFRAEWSLIGSSPSEAPFTSSDTFAFDLRNAANTSSLLKLQFTPGINIQSNSYTLQTVAAGSPTGILIDLGYGSLFTTQVDITGTDYSISLTRLDPTTRTVITNYSNQWSGVLATGTSSDDFATISLDWTLASGNNELPGSNYILVNEFAAVPEPTTYALFVSSAVVLGFVIRRRRDRTA